MLATCPSSNLQHYVYPGLFSLHSKVIRSPLHLSTMAHFPLGAALLPRSFAQVTFIFKRGCLLHQNYFSCCCDEILNKGNGKKDGLNVRHSLRVWGYSPSWSGSHGPRSSHCIHSEKAERLSIAQLALSRTSAGPTQGCSSDLIQTFKLSGFGGRLGLNSEPQLYLASTPLNCVLSPYF